MRSWFQNELNLQNANSFVVLNHNSMQTMVSGISLKKKSNKYLSEYNMVKPKRKIFHTQ